MRCDFVVFTTAENAKLHQYVPYGNVSGILVSPLLPPNTTTFTRLLFLLSCSKKKWRKNIPFGRKFPILEVGLIFALHLWLPLQNVAQIIGEPICTIMITFISASCNNFSFSRPRSLYNLLLFYLCFSSWILCSKKTTLFIDFLRWLFALT